MPSDRKQAPRWLVLLRSQGLGLACGMAVVVLLAIGSIVIAATRDGASQHVQLDDLRVFFTRPAVAHLWLYLLLPVFGLYGLNTLLATIDATARKWRAGQRSLRHHGPGLIHVAFLLTLAAHLVGGVGGAELRPRVLTPRWRPLGDGREVRVVKIEHTRHPNGGLRQVEVRLELRPAGSAGAAKGKQDRPVTKATLAYNRPLSTGFGARLWLLARARTRIVAQLSDGKRGCAVVVGGTCRLAGRSLMVRRILRGGHWGKVPAVRVSALDSKGKRTAFFLLGGRTTRFKDGSWLRLIRLQPWPEAIVRVREAPGNPVALGAVLLLVFGMLMMGRRWL